MSLDFLRRIHPNNPEAEERNGNPDGDANPRSIFPDRNTEDDPKKKRRPGEKRFWNWTIAEVIQSASVLTLVGTLWYSVKSYEVNRDALISVQRAFVTYGGLKIDRVIAPDGPGLVRLLQYKATWNNSGTTPAIDVFEHFRVFPMNREPTEDEFQMSGFLSPESARTPIAPKGTIDSGDVKAPEQDLLGVQFGDAPKNIMVTTKPMAFWGWAVYRDIFPKTKIHVTEFCQRADTAIIFDAPTKDPTLNMKNCTEHNCADNSCADYEDILKLFPRH